MTKKERKDHLGQVQDRTAALTRSLDSRYTAFTTALNNYVNEPSQSPLDAFFSVATSGDAYFSELKLMCDAYLACTIDKQAFRRSQLPNVHAAVTQMLPAFYDTLQSIASAQRIAFAGQLRRDNYESVFRVHEMHGT